MLSESDEHGQKLLLTAILCNDLKGIQTLLESDTVDLNFQYDSPFQYKTALEIACCEFLPKIKQSTIQLLVENGGVGSKAIYYAARENNIKIVEELLNNNLHLEDNLVLIKLINYIQRNQKNEEGYLEVFEILLEKVNINLQDGSTHCTAIYLAAKYGYQQLVNIILRICHLSVDLDIYKDKNLRTARDIIISSIEYSGELPKPLISTDIDENEEQSIAFKLLLKNIRQRHEEDFLQNYNKFIKISNNNLSMDTNESNNILLLFAAEKGLINAVRYLLYLGVDSNMIFKYYSELPLKYACIRGYYEIVELLMCYANPQTINVSLIEIVRTKFDENKIAKINHKKCYEMLLESEHLDINFKECTGNTAIHYASMHQQSEIILMLLRKGASLIAKNKNEKMCIDYLDAETLEKHLDECITFSSNINVPNQQQVEINFKTLLPENNFRHSESDVSNCLLQRQLESKIMETELMQFMSKKKELRPLLQHPVIDIFLFCKWNSTKKFILVNLIIYMLFMFFLMLTIYLKCKAGRDMAFYVSYNVSLILLIILLIIIISRELMQIIVFRYEYLKLYENWIEAVLIATTIVMLATDCSNIKLNNQLYALIIVTSSIELMLLSGRQFKIFFISSLMLQTVSKTLFKWLLSYTVLIISFSCCFYFIFNDVTDNKYFANVYIALFKTIVMITGEFELENLDFDTNYTIGPILFIVFVFLVNIVLLGVCTALAISDIQMILDNAQTKLQLIQLEHIRHWEFALYKSKLLRNFMKIHMICEEPVVKMLIRNHLKPVADRITNLHTEKFDLDSKTIRNIVARTEISNKFRNLVYPALDEEYFFNLNKTIQKNVHKNDISNSLYNFNFNTI